MQFKDFQQKVLDRLDEYLALLVEQRERSEKIAEFAARDPALKMPVPDYTVEAWSALTQRHALPAARTNVPFSPRRDGVGRPVPNICLKVPTGGGKTLLAAAAVSRLLSRWTQQCSGLVLWVCPNDAIYTQTRRALKDREHPYRQMLDQASGHRTRILEKDDPLHRADCDDGLNVMLLMLQSANRETKETLRLFRDRGSVNGFFPAADDRDAHAALLDAVPNLDRYSDVTLGWHQVKDSLGNALRVLRPIVVLDEGHKGYSRLAMGTIYGFNPSFVLELSATPADRPNETPPTYSNWLVDVRGTDLDREDMIKSPIEVSVLPGQDWRATLRQSMQRLDGLQRDADTLFAQSGRYLRPICLVQVERTGKDQRDGRLVHAEDVRDQLLTLGVREDQIAIKSADQNDLAAQDRELLDPGNPVRFIITKQALQEGWDCPFAYVLCSLATVTAKGAMTQLVGRILRQPETRKTGVEALDRCYVVCQHAKPAEVVSSIKAGLEQDGLGDLVSKIRENGGSGGAGTLREVRRRAGFEHLQVFLPKVLWVQGVARELDYECDLLARLDALTLDVAPLIERLRNSRDDSSRKEFRLKYDDQNVIRIEDRIATTQPEEFDAVFVCRAISDLVPNAWVAWDVVRRVFDGLTAAGLDCYRIGASTGWIIDELREFLRNALDVQAETLFTQDLDAGRIQFRLRTDGRNYRLDDTVETTLAMNAAQLVRENDGAPIAKSVFAPVYHDDFDGLERSFAGYVDSEAATRWWFRNVARQQYGVQGWRRHRVYPDFVVAVDRASGGSSLYVWETKGRHLDNPDSAYKQMLLRALTRAFSIEVGAGVGQLEIAFESDTVVVADLLLEQDWKSELQREYTAVRRDS